MNEPPSSLTLSGNTVRENSVPGTEIGVLRTEDPDRGQTFTYSLANTDADKGQSKYFSAKNYDCVITCKMNIAVMFELC